MVRDYTRVGAAGEVFNEFLNEFQRETDRAAAVLAAAFLDDQLGRLLKASLVSDHEYVEALFHRNGPAASFSSRISLAYAIGLIGLDEAKDLHRVRDIRNAFAHQLHGLSFDVDSIAQKCDHFSIVELFFATSDSRREWVTTPRGRFNLATSLLAFRLRSLLREPQRLALRSPLRPPVDEFHYDP